MKLTQGKAAQLAQVSKQTISVALKTGRLSGEKRPDGSFAIDPAELQRWQEAYGHLHPKASGKTPKGDGSDSVTDMGSISGHDDEIRQELARVTGELAGVREGLSAERRRADSAEAAAETWRKQFEATQARLTHAENRQDEAVRAAAEAAAAATAAANALLAQQAVAVTPALEPAREGRGWLSRILGRKG